MVNLIDRFVRKIKSWFSPKSRVFDEFKEFVSESSRLLREEEDIVVKEEGKAFLETFDFRQKIITRTLYCSGDRHEYFARTYEQNPVDREQQLLNALEARTIDRCSPPNEPENGHGYSDGFVSRDEVDSEYIFPKIEVGIR